MSPLDELHCRYDGPIPPAELAAAREAERQTPRRKGAYIGRRQLKAEVLVPAMAAAIVDLYRDHGCATEADLQRRGFTASDIARHGDAATREAQARLAA